jgi:hypothetical protein
MLVDRVFVDWSSKPVLTEGKPIGEWKANMRPAFRTKIQARALLASGVLFAAGFIVLALPWKRQNTLDEIGEPKDISHRLLG